jgi:hypothetical protein
MIQAICDEDPPIPGPIYSSEFNQFIEYCLQKDPQNRWSARDLLKSKFLDYYGYVQPNSYPSSACESSITQGTDTSFSAIAESIDQSNNQSPRSDKSKVSSLAARLTTVTIGRHSVTNAADLLSAKLNKFDSSDQTKILIDDDDFNLNFGDEENAAIYSIRLEHLGRVLDRIAEKLVASQSGNTVPGSEIHLFNVKQESDLFTTNSSLDILADNAFHKAEGKSFAEEEKPRSDDSALTEYNYYDRYDSKTDSDGRSILKISSHHQDVFEQRKSKWSESRNDTSNNSVRSVHFQEDVSHSHGHGHDHTFMQQSLGRRQQQSEQSLRNRRPKLKGLALDLEDEKESDNIEEHEPDRENFVINEVLPRPSSYFMKSSDHQPLENSSQSKNQVIHQIQPSRAQMAEDCKRMLPKLDSAGLPKWSHLAKQLNLPLHIVLMAAKSHLQGAVDDFEHH